MTGQTINCRPDLARAATRGQADRRTLVFDGHRKQALETGRTRLLVASIVFAAAFSVIGLRLLDLALIQGGSEPRLAGRETSESFRTSRADIVDRNGVVLATTLPVSSLAANARQIANPAEVAGRLATVLNGVHQSKLRTLLSSRSRFVWLKRGITPREKQAVIRLGYPGLFFKRESRRFYPHGSLAAHIVGFTSIDGDGIGGLELAFDEMLKGGTQPLELALDMRLQHILTEELQRAMTRFDGVGAAGLVLDVHTGETIAMVSLPSFDPKHVGSASMDARFNRATLGVYEMGSVFKIFTTAMALDAGVVDLRDEYDASKPLRVARFTINDFKPKDRPLSIAEIFIYSSNIGTAKMAIDAGTDLQRDYLDRLGLLKAAGIELPEVGTPMLPSPWRDINTITISYGHGLAVTPLQVANAVATVVNGGKWRPSTLIKRREGDVDVTHQVLSETTSRQMRWLMRLGVQHGTGGKADARGYLVGGKTGTADKLRGGSYSDDARMASFVSAFPMDDPRYVVLAMVDEPKGIEETYGYATGGWVAAPVVREVIRRAAPLLGVDPVTHDVEPEQPELLMEVAKR
ncbi:MAG: penicillin-binding protein 2 [Rhodovibrionaceae bacterium]|nr:penicillin-binding protein 2 [Rhodovibrionaceae bacterium]